MHFVACFPQLFPQRRDDLMTSLQNLALVNFRAHSQLGTRLDKHPVAVLSNERAGPRITWQCMHA